MFLSYPIALVFKYALHPDHTPITLRYAYSMTWGVIMGLLCFGPQQMAILLFINLVSYGLLIFLPPTVTQRSVAQCPCDDETLWCVLWCRYSMVWAMGSISTAHIYRLVTDYGGFHLDFTGYHTFCSAVELHSVLSLQSFDGDSAEDHFSGVCPT